MITDIQKKYLADELAGKIKKKDNPRKHSAYLRRMNEHIDHMLENLLWLAQNRPDILQDLSNELADEEKILHRRAKILLKAITLFENQPTVLELIAELYPEESVELVKK